MIVLLMGVTGSGKTTVGTLLAQRLGWEFVDGDQFHSAASVEKMRRGIPLTDADRDPWLNTIRDTIVEAIVRGKNLVLACSALKQSYRHRLLVGPEVKLVYLMGSRELISSRLEARRGHFATADLLASQFADLEEPADALTLDTSGTPAEIVSTILHALNSS